MGVWSALLVEEQCPTGSEFGVNPSFFLCECSAMQAISGGDYFRLPWVPEQPRQQKFLQAQLYPRSHYICWWVSKRDNDASMQTHSPIPNPRFLSPSNICIKRNLCYCIVWASRRANLSCVLIPYENIGKQLSSFKGHPLDWSIIWVTTCNDLFCRALKPWR